MKKFQKLDLDKFIAFSVDSTAGFVGGETCVESWCHTDDCDKRHVSYADTDDTREMIEDTYHEWIEPCI